MSDSKQFTYYPVVEGTRHSGWCSFSDGSALQGLSLIALLYSWLQIRKKWKESVRRHCLSSLSTLGEVHPWEVQVVELVDLALVEVNIHIPDGDFSII